MRVFLSYSFRKEDEPLADMVAKTLSAFGSTVETGKRLGGEDLKAEVDRRIERNDALVTMFTLRPKAKRDESTLDWVKYELQHARDCRKSAIALVEKGVPLKGPETSQEHLVFSRNKFAGTLLELAKTIMIWKEQIGRRVKVQLLPETLAEHFRHEEAGIECSVQYWKDSKREGAPHRIERVVPRPDGVFVEIELGEKQSFQMMVKRQVQRGTLEIWRSDVLSSDQLPVTLKQ